MSDVSLLPEELNSPAAHLAHDGLGRVPCGVVVHYLDLHLVRTRVLCEHPNQRLAKVVRAVISRDHHRPEWSGDSGRHWRNRRPKVSGRRHDAHRGPPSGSSRPTVTVNGTCTSEAVVAPSPRDDASSTSSS